MIPVPKGIELMGSIFNNFLMQRIFLSFLKVFKTNHYEGYGMYDTIFC